MRIVLEQADIAKLTALLGEVPFKHAAPIVAFLNEKLETEKPNPAQRPAGLRPA